MAQLTKYDKQALHSMLARVGYAGFMRAVADVLQVNADASPLKGIAKAWSDAAVAVKGLVAKR